MSEKIFYLGFAAFSGIGPKRFESLLQKFKSAEKAWNAKKDELSEIVGPTWAEKFVDFRKNFSPQDYEKSLRTQQIEYLTLKDKKYPELLRKIQSPPFVLFYKGNSDLFSNKKSIGIVGTRTISDYGKEVTQMLVGQLVEQDFVIISGLALGVDALAHQTALDMKGYTIAVLGSGVDLCTPSNNQKLYDGILSRSGAIVSTVPPGEKPNKGSFPARNRIIAGLSLGVVVTEGAADSGALYTADFAKKMGRPVFSVPGPITSRLFGATSKLLKDGGFAVTSVQDIIDKLGIMTKQTLTVKGKAVRGETKEEQKILDLLEIESLHFNEIVRRIGKDSKEIGSLLSLMELKGMIKCNSGGKYFV